MKNKNLLFSIVILFVTNCLPAGFISAQTSLWSMSNSGGAGGLGSVFKIKEDGSGYGRPYDFTVITPGSAPYYAAPCQASNGKIYGMTSGGGAYGLGVIFSFDPSTNKYTDLLDFNGANGSYAQGSLIQASNGKLYGMTNQGGANAAGLLFSFDTSAANPHPFTDLFDFDYFTVGGYPQGSLMQASNGKLYGMTSIGGANFDGTLFSFDTSSANPTPVTDMFDFNGANGSTPEGSLIQAESGKLYGMTNAGGANGYGVLFSYDPSSTAYSDLLDFDNVTYGGLPQGDLIQATNGKLYGMTSSGGANSEGLVFSFDTATANPTPFTDLVDFDGTNGQEPSGNLIQALNGKLYGMTIYGGANGNGMLFSFNPSGNVYSDVVDFDYTHGGYPYGSLVQASGGKLYGMAETGGVFSSGVLFSLNLSGNVYTDLVDFNGTVDGNNPQGSLVQTASGRVYGMTEYGGNYNEGVLFSIDSTSGSFNKLVDFNGTNGANPFGSLVLASNGNLYGMTEQGGTNGDGVLFSFNPSTNSFSKLIDFNGANGANPYGSLMQAASGKLYGMTSAGGANGYGVIFSFDPSSNSYSNLLSFNNTAGAAPYGCLMQGASGMLYGMASAGGTNSMGVLFSLDTNPANPTPYNDLLDFNTTNGANPYGSLMQASNGYIYGMTSAGGTNGYGVLFSFDTTASNPTPFTDLLNFNYTNGAAPSGSIIQGLDGKLFGMTQQGGAYGNGLLFSFSPPSTFTKLRDLNAPDGTAPVYSGFMEFNPIATGTISSSLCAGYSVSVPYTAVSNVFNNGNIFTAQLSDSTGSFATPVKIGTLTSKASGIINTVIPSNTPFGSGYRIRVIGTYPAVTGIYNGSNITIYPTPSVTASPSPDAICSATRTGITLTPGAVSGTTFSWSYAGTGAVTGTGAACVSNCGTSINDSLYNNGTVNANITYSITPKANGCLGPVVRDVVTVRPVPVATTNAGLYSICGGAKTAIIITSTTGGTTYRWTPYIESLPDNGSILDTISGVGSTIYQKLVNTGSTNGVVVYTINPSYIGCPGPAISCSVTIKPAPNGSASPSVSAICSGDHTGITLVPGTILGTTFTWSYSILGSITGTITACTSSCGTFINDSLYNTGIHDGKITYTIKTLANGCSGAPFRAYVTVRPITIASTSSSNTSICSGAQTSIPISSTTGAITLTYTPSITTSPDGGTITGLAASIVGAKSTIRQRLSNSGTSPGVVTYTVTPAYFGCPGPSINVSVTVNPIANGSSSPATEDINPGVHMFAKLDTGTVTGTTFTWTYKYNAYITGPPSICSIPGGSCGTTITDSLYNTVTSTENLTYTITPWAYGCAGTKFSHVVMVKPKPIATKQGNYTTCNGASTRILLTSSTSRTQFSYTASIFLSPDNGTITGFSNGYVSPIVQILRNTGTSVGEVVYTIIPDYEGSVGDPIYDTVTVYPVALGSCSPSVVGICSGSSIDITLIPTIDGLNTYFTWTSLKNTYVSGSSSCTTNCGTTIDDRLTTYVGSAVEIYTITPWTSGCAGTKFTANVTVQEGIPNDPVITGTTAGICPSPANYTYTVTNLAPFNTILWKLPEGCSIANGSSLTTNPITISYPSGFQADSVKASVTNLCGNTSDLVFLKTSSRGSVCRISSSGHESQGTMNIFVYPNPAHDNLNVEFNSASSTNCQFRLIDITGRLIIESASHAVQGENYIEFDVSNLAKGIYLLSLTSGDKTKQARIIVE